MTHNLSSQLISAMSPNTFLAEAVLFLTWHVPHGPCPELILQKPSWRLPISSHLVFTLIIVPMTLWKGLDAPICCHIGQTGKSSSSLASPREQASNQPSNNNQWTKGGVLKMYFKDNILETAGCVFN
jgi:hypothetical protein